jgi:hypothetical protein
MPAGQGKYGSSIVHVNSYDIDAPLPKLGTRWVWEIDSPAAREIVEVVDVFWNGEEWWVRTKTLLRNETYPSTGRETEVNDVERFWEACSPVLRVFPALLDLVAVAPHQRRELIEKSRETIQ